MATSTQQKQELFKTVWATAEDTRTWTNIKELNERIRRIVARENELRTEIDKIVTELEEDEL